MSRQVTPFYHITLQYRTKQNIKYTTSYHIISHDVTEQNKILHYIHQIISYPILIQAYTNAAAATNTQPLTSLTYQPEIPQGITSQNITSNKYIEVQSQS